MDYTDFVVDRAQHMRPLEYDMSESHNVLVRYLNDMGVLDNVPVGTLEPADILNASDALAAPLRSLMVYGNSVQDGTPTPEAPVPIQSVVNPMLTMCGFNLWDEVVEAGGINTGTGDNTTTAGYNRSKNYIPVLPSTECYIKSPVTMALLFYDADKAIIADSATYRTNTTFTTPANARYIRFRNNTVNAWPNYNHDICINFSDPARNGTYEPYKGNSVTLPVTLRSVSDDIRDIATYTYLRPSMREGWAWYEGELTRRVGVVDLGTLTWNNTATDIFNATISDMETSIAYKVKNAVYAYATNSFNWASIDSYADKSISTAGNSYVYVKDTSYTDTASFKAAMSGVMLYYNMATPTTELLPAIELPSNVGTICTIFATAAATPQLTAQYIRNLSASIADMQTAIADIISG